MRRYNEVLDSMDIAVSVAQDTYAFERQIRGQASKPSFIYNKSFNIRDKRRFFETCRDLKCLDRSYPLIIVKDPLFIPSIKSGVVGLYANKSNIGTINSTLPDYKLYDILADNTQLLKHIPTGKGIRVRHLMIPGFSINSVADFNYFQNELKPFCTQFKVKSISWVLKADMNLLNSIPKFESSFRMRNCIQENGTNLCAITNPLPKPLEVYNQYIYQEKGFSYFYRVNKLNYNTLYNVIYYINGKTVNTDIFFMNLFNISTMLG